VDAGRLAALRHGVVIPAHPLALTAERKLDERRQVALTRYYCDAGAGGIAVGVHTTQFAIREVGLYRPVLELAAAAASGRPLVKVAGICGATPQAVAEAAVAREAGYDLGLLSLAALKDAADVELLAHCCTVAAEIPLFGFYLQPAVGGRALSYEFWRRFCEIEAVAAIKVAPFNRYQTLDVVGAVAPSRRDRALHRQRRQHHSRSFDPFLRRPAGPVGRLDAPCSGTVGAHSLLSCRGRRRYRRAAGRIRGPDRRQCRAVRCAQRLCRLHRGHP